MNLFKKTKSLISVFIIAALTLAACSNTTGSSSSASEESSVVRVGVVGENNEQWNLIANILTEEGITLELVKFSDYTLPNQALAYGEIDLNAFQHIAFFENDVKTKGYELSIIGNTIITPLGLYSQKMNSISELQDGDKIAIPSDLVNGGRALKVLESAGLITVDSSVGFSPSVHDITDNPHNLEFIQVEAAQTHGLLPDVAASIINGGHAVDAGLNPSEDAIVIESVGDAQGNPFINVIIARTEDKDNELYKKVVAAYHTDAVRELIETVYKGAYLVAW